MEVRADEDEHYPLENWYLLERVISHKIPDPVLAVVRDYFDQCFGANPWIRFDCGLPWSAAREVFLVWLCDYNDEKDIGENSLFLSHLKGFTLNPLPPPICH